MRISILFLLLFWSLDVLRAQDQDTGRVNTQYFSVLLTNGQQYTGQMVHSDSAAIVLRVKPGVELNIDLASIEKMSIVSEAYFRRQQRSEANAPTGEAYFVNSSAYGPPTGEGYLAGNIFFFFQGNYAITDNFSLRAGGFLIPTLVAPRLTVPIVHDELALGAEGIIGLWPFMDDPLILMRGMATVGNRAAHLTASVGWPYINKHWASSPVYGLAVSSRISPRFGLMTENYLFPGNYLVGFYSLGGRIYKRKVSFDLGLVGFHIQDKRYDIFLIIPMPWFGMAFHLY